MGLVRAGRRRSREGDEPLLLHRLETLVSFKSEEEKNFTLEANFKSQLGEEYPGLPRVLELLLCYQPDKRMPASRIILVCICVLLIVFAFSVFVFCTNTNQIRGCLSFRGVFLYFLYNTSLGRPSIIFSKAKCAIFQVFW